MSAINQPDIMSGIVPRISDAVNLLSAVAINETNKMSDEDFVDLMQELTQKNLTTLEKLTQQFSERYKVASDEEKGIANLLLYCFNVVGLSKNLLPEEDKAYKSDRVEELNGGMFKRLFGRSAPDSTEVAVRPNLELTTSAIRENAGEVAEQLRASRKAEAKIDLDDALKKMDDAGDALKIYELSMYEAAEEDFNKTYGNLTRQEQKATALELGTGAVTAVVAGQSAQAFVHCISLLFKGIFSLFAVLLGGGGGGWGFIRSWTTWLDGFYNQLDNLQAAVETGTQALEKLGAIVVGMVMCITMFFVIRTLISKRTIASKATKVDIMIYATPAIGQIILAIQMATDNPEYTVLVERLNRYEIPSAIGDGKFQSQKDWINENIVKRRENNEIYQRLKTTYDNAFARYTQSADTYNGLVQANMINSNQYGQLLTGLVSHHVGQETRQVPTIANGNPSGYAAIANPSVFAAITNGTGPAGNISDVDGGRKTKKNGKSNRKRSIRKHTKRHSKQPSSRNYRKKNTRKHIRSRH
jgi:hypothetical protein